jgi:hypothetical protein
MNQVSPEFFTDMQSKSLEAFAVWNDMNHRVLQELVGLSAAAAKESLRTYAEIQSASADAARRYRPAVSEAESVAGLRQNPFTVYQHGLLSLVEGTQQAFKLVEANAQVVTRSAERLQASADRTGQEIHEALSASVGRIKEIYGRS